MDRDTIKIHDFAQRWIDAFQAGDLLSAEQLLGEECEAIGFVMDTGASLKQQFPEALEGHEKLALCIHHIEDMASLGNAIYSQWRYYQHWACSPWDVQWFLIALKRLSELASGGSHNP